MSPNEFLIWWNNTFKYDRSFRKKYNIAFGSVRHKKISQIDVFLDMQEDRLYEKHIKLHQEEKEGLEVYQKTGRWQKESTLDEKTFDELFDKINIDDFNKKEE